MSTIVDISKVRSKITALVVDDDLINQKLHHKLLDTFGVANQVVGNGKEALEAHSSGKIYDLILMDRDMPIMNGVEATKKLRAMGIHSIIAGVSARSLEQEKQEFIQAGIDLYYEKPLTRAKLMSILSKFEKEMLR